MLFVIIVIFVILVVIMVIVVMQDVIILACHNAVCHHTDYSKAGVIMVIVVMQGVNMQIVSTHHVIMISVAAPF
jgi:hypothetical protein